MSASFEKITFHRWPDCIRFRHGDMELIVSTCFGPRILHLGFTGGENFLHLEPEQLGLVGGADWRIYGGHRLWHAPEAMPRTYSPDNDPVSVDMMDDGVRLIQKLEPSTGMQKEMEITFLPAQNGVRVLHRLRNLGPAPIELAPWGLSVLAGEGTLIIPQEPFESADTAMAPARAVALWPYTKLQDPRWHWGDKYLLANFDPAHQSEQKLGVTNTAGWMAYALKDEVLIKIFPFTPGATYPDFGCNAEVYIDGRFIEMETLGVLSPIMPGLAVEHIEYWFLEKFSFDGSDAGIDAGLLPRVRELKQLMDGK